MDILTLLWDVMAVIGTLIVSILLLIGIVIAIAIKHERKQLQYRKNLEMDELIKRIQQTNEKTRKTLMEQLGMSERSICVFPVTETHIDNFEDDEEKWVQEYYDKRAKKEERDQFLMELGDDVLKGYEPGEGTKA